MLFRMSVAQKQQFKEMQNNIIWLFCLNVSVKQRSKKIFFGQTQYQSTSILSFFILFVIKHTTNCYLNSNEFQMKILWEKLRENLPPELLLLLLLFKIIFWKWLQLECKKKKKKKKIQNYKTCKLSCLWIWKQKLFFFDKSYYFEGYIGIRHWFWFLMDRPI